MSAPDPVERRSAAAGPGRRPRERDAWRELARFLPDVAKLLWSLVRDERVPVQAKVAAGAAVAYVVSPVDLIPDFLGRFGRADDAYVVTRALQFLAQEAGYDLLHEHWPGSEDGFALLLAVSGVER